jgi:pSer/pThr/pTyr-binding forkhead associated (FHA) protein
MEMSMSAESLTELPLPEKNVYLIVNRQMISIDKPTFRLGRQLENDLVFHEEFVSRFHAEIRYESDAFILYDNGSTGGTFVNGKKIDRCILNSGDLISIGTIQVMFVNNNPRLIDRAKGTTQSLHEKERMKHGKRHPPSNDPDH